LLKVISNKVKIKK